MKKIKENKKIVIVLILGIIWSSLIIYSTQKYILKSNEYDYKVNNKESGVDMTSTTYLAGLNSTHPIGSIFMTVNSNYNTAAKVGTALGGTWEAIGEGRVLIGAGTNGTYTFEAGSTGGSTVAGNNSSASQTITNPLGEYTHKLVVNELAKHRHTVGVGYYYGYSNSGGSGTWIVSGSYPDTNYTGSDYYHNNIQPYLVVYMYKRTV